MNDIRSLKLSASTNNPHQFKRMLQFIPDRVNIVAEGDSWFDYPREHLIGGPPANVIDHIQRRTRYKANLLRLASNGDEAVEILSGGQRFELCGILEDAVERENPVHLLLFSGGGNDFVGRYVLDRLLKLDASDATTPEACFRPGALDERFKQIEHGYKDLIHACAKYSPDTVIVTHTYDRPFPDGRPAEFLKAIKRGPWMKPFLVDAKVPHALRRPVVLHMIDRFAELVKGLALEHPERFIVVDTRMTLRRKRLWKDELHPTSEGFEALAKKIYAPLKERHPELSDW